MSLDLYPPVQRDPLVNPENAAFDDIERDSRFLTATPTLTTTSAQMPTLEAPPPPIVALAHQTTDTATNEGQAGLQTPFSQTQPVEQPVAAPPLPGSPGAIARSVVSDFRAGHPMPPEIAMPAPEDANPTAIQATYQATEVPVAQSVTPDAQPLYQTSEAAPQPVPTEQPNPTDIQFSPAAPEPVQPTVAPGLYQLRQTAATPAPVETHTPPLSPWSLAAQKEDLRHPNFVALRKERVTRISHLPIASEGGNSGNS